MNKVFVERRALVVDNGEVVQDDYIQGQKDVDGTLTVDGRVDGQPIHYQQLPHTRKQMHHNHHHDYPSKQTTRKQKKQKQKRETKEKKGKKQTREKKK